MSFAESRPLSAEDAGLGTDNLLYRNQFVLGHRYRGELRSWKRLKVGKSWYLTVHPDLNTCQVASDNIVITLLGYLIDPRDSEARDEEILRRIIRDMPGPDGFAAATSSYGGRWALIIADRGSTLLFNDAAGLRQIFYSHPGSTGEMWCASQPGLIASHLKLDLDPLAVDFVDSYAFRKNREFRWPGHSTLYRQIDHLLPNHCLELETGTVRRYWPVRALAASSPEQAMEKAAPLLQGLMNGISMRFPLALSITSGIDSRIVLASSRGLKEGFRTMTVRQIDMPEDHADITIPKLLAKRFDLSHDIVKSSLLMDDGFVSVFKRNVPAPHYIYAPDAQAILRHYGQARVAVTGSASEIARSSFRTQLRRPVGEPVTAQDLARLQGMGVHPFAVESFSEWLGGIGDLHGIDMLDLFEWEQGHGNWLAMCQLEFDIAWKDIFTPFNCRELLEILLSADRACRIEPGYELFEGLIRRLWPELLTIPINPHRDKKVSLISAIRTGLRRRLARLL